MNPGEKFGPEFTSDPGSVTETLSCPFVSPLPPLAPARRFPQASNAPAARITRKVKSLFALNRMARL